MPELFSIKVKNEIKNDSNKSPEHRHTPTHFFNLMHFPKHSQSEIILPSQLIPSSVHSTWQLPKVNDFISERKFSHSQQTDLAGKHTGTIGLVHLNNVIFHTDFVEGGSCIALHILRAELRTPSISKVYAGERCGTILL